MLVDLKRKTTPFIKWAGGKRQLLPELKKRLPSNFNNYYEVFLGGGALFFDLQVQNAFLNDINEELISVYKEIRDNPYKLMEELDKLETLHNKEYYYEIREWDRLPHWDEITSVKKAARMIYLNKSCFNGLYRINKKGEFNVPFNQKEIISTYDKENILNISELLNDSKIYIFNKDFEEISNSANKDDFLFFDPPYDLLKKDTFDSYTKDSFGKEGQIRLAKLFKKLDERGCFLMLTNHNTELIQNLYSEYKIETVAVKRMINSNSKKRTGSEVIITNY